MLPAGFFTTEIAVTTIDSKPVKSLVDRRLADDLPIDFDATFKGLREATWRSDTPATLVWAEALDAGNPRAKVAFNDKVMMQAAPFDAAPVEPASTRHATTMWGNDGLALVIDREWRTRTKHRIAVAPSRPGRTRAVLTRNYQDQYGNRGFPIAEENTAGKPVMRFTPAHNDVYVNGDGAAKAGRSRCSRRCRWPVASKLGCGLPRRRITRQSSHCSARRQHILTRRESAKLAPNYMVRGVKGGNTNRSPRLPIPRRSSPASRNGRSLNLRADGLQLSDSLYLPAGYDAKRDAYPAEFTDSKVAGQTVDLGNRFGRPRCISHLFRLTQGCAIFDSTSMPIIGEGGAEANDTYVMQLQQDAQAPVDAVVKSGVSDRSRMAVDGHGYGALNARVKVRRAMPAIQAS